MNRRDFLKYSATLAAAGGITYMTGCGSGGYKNADNRPNIIFMLVDDLGWDEPLCYGGRTGMNTPNIDKLAAGGVRFTFATGFAYCSPARAQLMSGRYGFRTGINANVCDPGGGIGSNLA